MCINSHAQVRHFQGICHKTIMELSCYQCGKDFDEISKLFTHLKRHHDLKTSTDKLKCMVKNVECLKTFMNFDSLRQHMKKCSQNRSVPLHVTCGSTPTPMQVISCTVLALRESFIFS